MPAWTTPHDFAALEVVTSTTMDALKDNLLWLGQDFPRATAIGTITVANGSTFATPTGSWSSASPNVGSMYSSGSMYLTASSAGVYIFTATVIFPADDDGKRGVALSSSAAGAGTIYASDRRTPVQSTEATAITITTPPTQLSAAAQVHLGIRQNSGASLDVPTRFGGYWIGT